MAASAGLVEFGPVVVLTVVLAAACHAPVVPPAPPAASAVVPQEQAALDWAAGEAWFVRVSRSCRTLSVYHRGQWVRTYQDLAFGRNAGDKLEEGDRKTPLGLYRMVGRRVHPRWSHFILLDYPNAGDRERHGQAAARGLVTRGPGAAIGIHGSDEPLLNRAGVDWTYGCVSLLDEDMAALYAEVPEGTLVLIEP